ncbi:hypothetical protein [Pseudochrobactrum sp. MP213Fo]|uniref:hypothetical protein n=1 Tax=Pseudochrobactrum sp. MP213Fo TaxID=3022250 RepID=UPI003BA223B2
MSLFMPRTSFVKTLTLTALIAPLWAGTALAWTGDDVAKRLQNLLKEQMVELTYSKAETDGQTVILRDAKAQISTPDTEEDAESDASLLNLGDITLAGITEAADGVYVVDKASLADTKIIADGTIVTAAGIRIERLKLPENPKIDILGRMEYLEALHVGELSLTDSGKAFIKLSDFFLTNEPYTKEKASNFSWGFKALDLDLEEIDRVSEQNRLKKAALEEEDEQAADAAEEADTAARQATKRSDDNAVEETEEPEDATASVKRSDPVEDAAEEATDETVADEEPDATDSLDMETIRAFGLEKIHLTMDAKGSWSPYSGKYSVDSLTLNGQNIGNFSYQLHMGGYDMKFVKAMQDFYTSTMQDGADNTSMQVAAMGLLQNLSISNMEMRYDDASFANKLIEHEAKKKSLSRSAFVQEIKDQLNFGVAYFEGEQRVVDAAKAIGEFLDAPKSINFKIQPEQPVSFAILTAVGMAEPKKLWSVLGVKVEANN